LTALKNIFFGQARTSTGL